MKKERKKMTEKNNMYKPSLHFTPSYGWMNDPNGLVYHDGIYELYYQHNPRGIDWNCMTWGHARGTDLLHWEDLGDVLEPDENGLMFSGCAIRNDRGLLGLPKDALLFFYTAAGHSSRESKGKPYTIRLAYSTDGGNTLIKKDGICEAGEIMETLAAENRDPKVFWHEESGAYILVLWIENNDFGIWRSEDLEQFTMTQRVTLESGYECPDLFRLPVISTKEGGRETGEEKWVFWTAHGYYYVGSFDGYEFHQEQERRCASQMGPDVVLPYAAQTFSGPEKVLSVSWLRTKCVGGRTTGMMSIPKEFSLIRNKNGYILRQNFPSAVMEAFAQTENGILDGACCLKLCNQNPLPFVPEPETMGMHDEDMEWEIRFLSKETCLLKLECQRDTKKLFFTRGIVTDSCETGCELENLELIYDHGILELLGNNGTFYLAVDFPELRAEAVDKMEMSENLKEWI